MATPDITDEDDIWNYKSTASKKESSGKKRCSKSLSDVGEERKETIASSCTRELAGPVIDVDLEEDFAFTNFKPVSNERSSKQWTALFSKTERKEKVDSETHNKDKNSIRQNKNKRTAPKSLQTRTKKQRKSVDPMSSKSNDKHETGSACKTIAKHFSPLKSLPEKQKVSDGGECSSSFSEETDELLEHSVSEMNNDKISLSGDMEKRYDIAGSGLGKKTDQSALCVLNDMNVIDEEYDIDEHLKVSFDCKNEPKVVDVIVIEEDVDGYLAANDIHNVDYNAESDSDMFGDDHELAVSFVKDDHGSAGGFLKDDHGSAGGFLKDDHGSAGGFLEDDQKSEDIVSENENKFESHHSAEIFKAGSSKEKLDDEAANLPCSSLSSFDKLRSDFKSTLDLHNSVEPLPTAARKQTSLFSFFHSKPSLTTSKHKTVAGYGPQKIEPLRDLTDPPRKTFSRGYNGWQPKPSKAVSDVSERVTATDSRENIPGRGRQRQCPFYKKIPGTNITVDAFRYGTIPGCNVYFLTHFHYDHYGGLTKKFAQPIYCSGVTANLVERRLGVDKHWVNRLPLWKPVQVDGVTLTLMEANHCPGAVIVLFETNGGKKILHTGDYRASLEMEEYPALKNIVVDELYLDTTYCNPSYAFPSQKTVIDFAVSLVQKQMALNPKTLIVCGAYTIGKERIFSAIAKTLDSKICVMSDKKKVLDCLDDEDLKKRLTLTWSEGQVHVLPMSKLKQEFLFEHHARHSRFASILAFEPTGWTHSAKAISLENLQPKWSRNGVTLYGIPYSEHSSYLELKRFVQFIRPKKILPTVNNGNPAARQKMEDIFRQWLSEKSPPNDDDAGMSQQLKMEDWMGT